ncbi:MAG: hypothetical protein JJ992_00175, partial [Planctomycetes bacterium]|nr:hypothetical protein [Planctomycetota bacterium]
MPSYDWRLSAERPVYDRFPEWANGYPIWRELLAGRWENLEALLDDLDALRGEISWGQGYLTCPRVFVSHRRCDVDEALEIA